MLVFSKTMKDKVFKELVKQFKNIPSPIKEQMIAFARRNSYRVWKEYLMLLYNKYSKKQPKHLGKYLKHVIRRIKKIRKSNFGGYSFRFLPNEHWYDDDWERNLPEIEDHINREAELIRQRIEEDETRLRGEVRRRGLIAASQAANKARGIKINKLIDSILSNIKKIERKSNFGGVIIPHINNPEIRELIARILRQRRQRQIQLEEYERQRQRQLEGHQRRMAKLNTEQSDIKRRQFGKKKIKRKSKMSKKVPESLKKKCRKLKVRLTVKRGKKRVYKSEKVLKKQCKTAMKKKVKRKRKFGAARKGHRVVPMFSHKFGRPYFGYVTSSRASRFGSGRPEFHYPEHVLKGYNTAKTNKKFRFGRPHRHPLRYSHYNPSKTGKKYR